MTNRILVVTMPVAALSGCGKNHLETGGVVYSVLWGGCAAHGGPEGAGNAHRCRRQQRQASTQRGGEGTGTA